MTDTYLRSLGFAPTARNARTTSTSFARAWSYQFDYMAADGTPLFIEHPLGIDACRLSSVAAPLAAHDVFASVGLHDRPAFEAAIKAFYAAHGGMGAPVARAISSSLHPIRYQY